MAGQFRFGGLVNAPIYCFIYFGCWSVCNFFDVSVGFFQPVADFYATFIVRHLWLQPLLGRVYIAAACVFVLDAAAVNYDIRGRQYAAWKAHPDITHFGDTPVFSTADAPNFIEIAAELKRGKAPQTRPMRPISLALTGEMAGWMQAITKIASWDIDHGQWQDS